MHLIPAMRAIDGGFVRYMIKVRIEDAPRVAPLPCKHELIKNSIADTLPDEVRLQLCMNRQELKLADRDGQIWTQLVLMFNSPESIIRGEDNTNDICKRIGAALRLDGENATKLPNRMLIILRNNQWNQFTTSWCKTAIGKETFNASKWVNMIAHRLDYVSPALLTFLNLLAPPGPGSIGLIPP